MLPTHNRYAYSNITTRPDYSWPAGKRLAVYVALNIEQFRYGAGKGAAIAPPDQATSHRTGCEFSVTPKLLAWATMEGNSIIRGAMRSEKWWDSVAADGAGMRVIAAFFGPYAP